MQNRARNIQIKFYVTPEEKEFILKKMRLVKINHIGAYLRKQAIDGYCINVDMTMFKNLAAEVNKIGVNINQTAKKINADKPIYNDDILQMKEMMTEIWQLLRQSLSVLQLKSR